jgi:hypothetical protein
MDEASWHLAGARLTYAPILFSRRRCSRSSIGTCRIRAGRPPRARSHGRDCRGPRRPNFDLTSEHSLGSAWRPKLEAARCDAGDRARIPVPPEPFGFVLEATCRDLR